MRVVFWDLETTDLKALMGRVLCCSFKPLGEKVYTYRTDEKPYIGRRLIDDSKLVRAVRDELESYNLIVGHNIKMFDIPFLNARLAKHGQRKLRPQFVLDTMYYVGYSAMRIGSKRLDNVQKYFELAEAKTPLDWETWQEAGAGDRKSLNNVVKHCEQDVKVLEELYPIILEYVSNLHRAG